MLSRYTLCILMVLSHRHMIHDSCMSCLPIRVQEIPQKLSRTYTSSSDRHWGKGETNSWNKILKEKGDKDKLGKLYADTKADILQMYLSRHMRTIGIYKALALRLTYDFTMYRWSVHCEYVEINLIISFGIRYFSLLEIKERTAI